MSSLSGPVSRPSEVEGSTPPLPFQESAKFRIPSWGLILAQAFLFALFVFATALAIDYTLLVHRDSPLATVEVSDALAGLLAGGLFLRILLAGRSRRERLLYRLRMINDMNDRIRNALQVIQFTAHSNPGQKEVQEIDHAVKRIQTALDEVSST
jgi:hypothetical protein